MLTDPVYYKLDVPDGQRQTVETLAKRICRKHGINCANILITNVAFPEEQVIDTQYLSYLSSIPPDVAAILPAIPALGFLVAQFGNIIIIPEWLVDIYGAAHGDREAATRRVKHLVERIGQVILPEMFRRSARELRVPLGEAQFTVMTNAFLEVLSYRNTPLDIESVADHVRLQHPDGSREMASPKTWGEYVLWRWAEVETVRNTMSQLSLTPYSPVIQIEAIPPDGEPARLWMYPPSEHLVLPRRDGGRPRGRTSIPEERFRREYPQKYFHLLESLGGGTIPSGCRGRIRHRRAHFKKLSLTPRVQPTLAAYLTSSYYFANSAKKTKLFSVFFLHALIPGPIIRVDQIHRRRAMRMQICIPTTVWERVQDIARHGYRAPKEQVALFVSEGVRRREKRGQATLEEPLEPTAAAR